MAIAFEQDPTLTVKGEKAADQESHDKPTPSCGEILEGLGADLERSPSAMFFAEAFVEEPMCWVGLVDVLNSSFRGLIVEQVGVNNDNELRAMFFDATQELTRIDFLQTRRRDVNVHGFRGVQFRYNPKQVEKRIADLFAVRAKKAGKVALDDAEEYSWQDQANCLGVDPDLFFPERGASTREAKDVCRGCTVRLDCLEYALTGGEKFGIWGGLSERERRRLRRQRSQAARKVQA